MTLSIRALLVEDNRIQAHQIKHWLAAGTEGIEVEWVQDLTTALERLARAGTDVVLLDLNLPDQRGLETFTTLHQQFPEVPVVILTGEHDESLGLLAVQQGAEDYLVKQDLDGGKLAKIVQFAVIRRRTQTEILQTLREKPGRVISFVGSKGGVGTTTLALNVATALAQKERSVILAELKPSFGGLSGNLQRTPATSLMELLQSPVERIGQQSLTELMYRGPAGMRILFGTHPGAVAEALDAERTSAVISNLASLADCVVLDLPCWSSQAVAAAVRLSQYVGVVIEREELAVHCGQTVIAQLETWGIGGGQMGAIVVCRSNLAVSLDLGYVQTRMGCPIIRVVPLEGEACCRSHREGSPLVLLQPANEAAKAYVDIANLVAEDRVTPVQVI